MATRTITFLIEGKENLSAAINSAKSALNSLRGVPTKINALQRSLARAQDLQKMINDYRGLQRAIQASQSARAQELLKASRNLSAQAQATKQLEKMKDSYKALQKYQRGEKLKLDTDKASVARLKSTLQQFGSSMNADAAKIMRQQIQAAEREIKSREKSLNQIMSGAKVDLRAQEAAIKNFGASFDSANAKAQRLRATLASQQAQLASLRNSMSAQGLGGGVLAGHEMRLRAEIQQTINAINRETEAFNRRNAAAQNFSNAQQNMANAYQNFQNSLDTAQTIMNPFVDATKVAMTFEKQMDRVKSVTQMRNIRAGNLDAVEKSMAALTEQAEHLGATTEFTQIQVAQGQEKLGYAGWTDEQIRAAMPQIIDLASISPAHNVERMADILSDTATAMGIKAGDTIKLGNGKIVDAFAHYADSWAYATTTANLNDEDLFTALKYNAGAMKLAGLTQGDIFAANMLVANAGLKGSMAGTAFRSGMIRLQAPPKAGAKALEEMGFNASEAQKQMAAAGEAMHALGIEGGSVMDKIVAIKQRYDELGKTGNSDAQAQLINDIFGKNAFQAWAEVLRSGNLDQMKQIAEEINSGFVDGWASDAAAITRDNTATQIEYLKSAWDALQKSIGDAFLGGTTGVAQGLTDLIGKLNEFVKENQTAVQYAGLLAAALATVVVVGAGLAAVSAAIGFISSGLALLAPVVTAVGAAFAFLTSPIFLAVAAVVAFIAVVAVLINNADRIKQALSDAWNHPRGAVIGFCELVKSAISSAVDFALSQWLTLKSALENPIEAALNFAKTGSVVGGNVVNGAERVKFMHMIPTSEPRHSGGSFAPEPSMPTYQAFDFHEMRMGQYTPPQATLEYQPPQQTVDAAQIAQPVADAANQTGSALTEMSAPVQESGAALQGLSYPAQELASAMPTLPPEMQNLATSTQTATPQVDALGSSSQSTTPQVDMLGTSSQGAGGNVQALGNLAIGACVNIAALSGAASAVASALQSVAAQISSIHISVPQISFFPMSVGTPAPVASNAAGGIYNQGTFLSTLAEKSPESVIPIDSSARAKNLWLETGDRLGLLGGGNEVSAPININVTMNFNGERPENNSWIDEVRDVFSDLAEEYFSNRRRVSYV
ncbi:MAG: phage tail tape measure protein [Selenomonadaceae bacterium]|nr:phage tail tape measure protein [Selenomonadaceae bacterium]